MVKDVETLNDEIKAHANTKVTVEGEVKDKLDSRSFVLESGGIFDDEILVVMGPNLKNLKTGNLKGDKTFKVTGKVETRPIIEVRRELSWDLDPQVEAEVEGITAFIVADQVVANK